MIIDVATLKQQAGKIWVNSAKNKLTKEQETALGNFYLSHKLNRTQIIALLKIREPADFVGTLITYLWHSNQETLLHASQNTRYNPVIKASVYEIYKIEPSFARTLAIRLNFSDEELNSLKPTSQLSIQSKTHFTDIFTKIPIYTLFEKNVNLPAISEVPATKRETLGSTWNIINQNHGVTVAKLAHEQANKDRNISCNPATELSLAENLKDKFHKLKLRIYELVKKSIAFFTSNEIVLSDSSTVVTTPERQNSLAVSFDEPTIDTPPRSDTSSYYAVTEQASRKKNTVRKNLTNAFNASSTKENISAHAQPITLVKYSTKTSDTVITNIYNITNILDQNPDLNQEIDQIDKAFTKCSSREQQQDQYFYSPLKTPPKFCAVEFNTQEQKIECSPTIFTPPRIKV